MLENDIKLTKKVVTVRFHNHGNKYGEKKPTISNQMDNYLNHITNLDDYTVHISRIFNSFSGDIFGYVTLIKRPISPKYLQKELDTIKRYADGAGY